MVSPQRACLAASFRDDSRHCLQHSWPYHRASIQRSCANWPWAKVFPACEDQAGWSQDGWCSCQPCSMVCRPANSLRSPEEKHVTLWKLWERASYRPLHDSYSVTWFQDEVRASQMQIHAYSQQLFNRSVRLQQHLPKPCPHPTAT